MLFAKALLTFFVAFTVCVSAAPAGKRGATKAVATRGNSRPSTRSGGRASVKATTKRRAAAKGKGNAKGKSPRRKMTVKKVKARGNRRLAAVPRDFEESSLEEIYARANPSAATAQTFYRAIGGAAVDEALGLINQPPAHYRAVKGDFAVDGGFYMFAEKTNAEKIAAEKLQMKSETKTAVLTLSWTPPAGLKLKRWDAVDDEWRTFTEACNQGGTTRPAIQTSFDFIEGPMSTKKDGKREQLESYYQYAIPSNAFDAMKGNLKITAVEEVKLAK